jgi:hypothetical protein
MPFWKRRSGAARLRSCDSVSVIDGADNAGQPYETEESVAELVRRSLIQLGDMEAVQDRVKMIGQQLSRLTPPSHRGSRNGGSQDGES